jgi:probable rRNA maturation factor
MAIEIEVFNHTERKFLPLKKMKEAASNVFLGEGRYDVELNIIILDDSAIHQMNIEFLQHDYPTDVITFNLDEENFLAGEIYISADTAEIQSKDYKVSLTNELMRLAAHGALHLCGYDDETPEQREYMHSLENKYITK